MLRSNSIRYAAFHDDDYHTDEECGSLPMEHDGHDHHGDGHYDVAPAATTDGDGDDDDDDDDDYDYAPAA